MAYRSPWYQQQRQDTGWGLIYRLNLLLGKIENDIEASDLEKWNLHLDRIYVNILYRNSAELLMENGKITDVKFTKEDTQVFSKFNEKIQELKKEIKKIMDNPQLTKDYKKEEHHRYRMSFYNLLFKKDVWIRKRMFEMNLYLREVEYDPRKAIYGG